MPVTDTELEQAAEIIGRCDIRERQMIVLHLGRHESEKWGAGHILSTTRDKNDKATSLLLVAVDPATIRAVTAFVNALDEIDNESAKVDVADDDSDEPFDPDADDDAD